MTTPAVISFERVSKTHGALRALDGVSLAVPEGQFLAVVGPSGSGKTTLLRLVNRLTEASDGVVRVEGEDVRAVDPIGLRRRIGYVFQNIGLFPHMTVA
jgi:osmoprotectant transport system ATP-binding protein